MEKEEGRSDRQTGKIREIDVQAEWQGKIQTDGLDSGTDREDICRYKNDKDAKREKWEERSSQRKEQRDINRDGQKKM